MNEPAHEARLGQQYCPLCDAENKLDRFADMDRYYCTGCHAGVEGPVVREYARKLSERPAHATVVELALAGTLERFDHAGIGQEHNFILTISLRGKDELSRLIADLRNQALAIEDAGWPHLGT